MARALRRPTLTAAALAALVGVSLLLHWLAGRRVGGLWIMPDEAIYGVRALGLWEHGSLPILNGQGAGYSALYPLLAGGPLSLGSLSTGYAWLKVVQALVMSLAAIPVYLYGRRTMPARYALLAAALTVASPLLLYSGFLMTEVVAYPLTAATLLVIARAVETGRLRDQVVALLFVAAMVATRVQAVVLVAVFAAAVLVDALLAVRRPRFRAFWPVWALLAVAPVAGLAAPDLLGAYSSTLRHGYPVGRALGLVYDHLAYTIVMVAVVPVAATIMLLVGAVRGRERDPAARSLLAVTVSAVLLVAAQVGVFASGYARHLLERDLSPLPPLLFLCFSLWLARGAPRPRIAASLVVVGVLAVLVAAPWNHLVDEQTLPDSMGIALLLRRFWGVAPATAVAVGAAVLLVLVRFLPRRALAVLPFAVLALLTATSVVASNLVSQEVRKQQVELVGMPRNWIERTVNAPVAYLFDGDFASWTVVWAQRFWNPRIGRVVSLSPAFVPGPLHEVRIPPPRAGLLPMSGRYVVANDRNTFVGTPVAHQSRGPNQFGLTLWKLDGPPRLLAVEHGFRPNGDIWTEASVTAYDCAGGDLQLTLLPKATDKLEIDLDGRPVVQTRIAGLASYHTRIPVPADHPPGPCTFRIVGGPLLGSTRVLFEHRST